MPLPVLRRYYFIVPACNQDMALGGIEGQTTLPNGSVMYGWGAVLRPITDRHPLQRYGVYSYREDGGVTGLYMQFMAEFVEPRYGLQTKWIPMFTGYHNAPISLQDPRNMSTRGCWNLIPHGDFFAIQNYDDNGQNLNVAGDGPYPENTPIYAYGWSGGASNEIWKFVEFD